MRYDSKSIMNFYKTGRLEPTPPNCFQVLQYSDTSFKFWCRNNNPSMTGFSRNEKLKIKARLEKIAERPMGNEINWLKL